MVRLLAIAALGLPFVAGCEGEGAVCSDVTTLERLDEAGDCLRAVPAATPVRFCISARDRLRKGVESRCVSDGNGGYYAVTRQRGTSIEGGEWHFVTVGSTECARALSLLRAHGGRCAPASR